MNHAFAACEEMRSSFFCPKPRRLAVLSSGDNDPIRPLSHHSERCESKSGTDLLDIIRPKVVVGRNCETRTVKTDSNRFELLSDSEHLRENGGYGVEQCCAHVASSPPFFSGSPPSRVSNPLIQDTRFGDERFITVSPQGSSLSQASSTQRGGCVRAHFGNNPAVRIEGFDCLDSDSRNRSIPALA